MRTWGIGSRPCSASTRSNDAMAASVCPAWSSRTARLLVQWPTALVWPRPISSNSSNPARSAWMPRPNSPMRASFQATPSRNASDIERWPGRGVPITCRASRYCSSASFGNPAWVVRMARELKHDSSSVGSACGPLRSAGRAASMAASATAASGVSIKSAARRQSASARSPVASGPAASVARWALSSTAATRSVSSISLYSPASVSCSRACNRGASLN